MKKSILIGLIIFMLGVPALAAASAVGNPSDTEGLFIGILEYDGVLNRDLKLTESTLAAGPVSGFSLDSNRLLLKDSVRTHLYQFPIDIFIKIGAADLDYEYTDSFGEVAFEGDWGFAWGFGSRLRVFETNGYKFFLGGDFFRVSVPGKTKFDGVTVTDVNGLPLDSETSLNEWQGFALVSRNLNKFTPYGGVKYSDVELKNTLEIVSGFSTNDKAESENNFGIFAGADYVIIPQKLSASIEGRLIDETAITMGLNFALFGSLLPF